MKKVVVFRNFAREATKNSHTAIKACWTILFTGGTLALLRSFDELIQCKFPLLKSGLVDIHCIQSPDDFSFWLSISLFIIYILTFYRFYVGNIRVFDIRYDEVFKFIDSLHDEKNQKSGTEKNVQQEAQDYQSLLNYSDNLSKGESIYLIIPTFIIVYLTVTPSNPLKFLWVYLSLLVVDIVWLAWDLWTSRAQDEYRKYLSSRFFKVFCELENTGFDKKLPEKASRKWRTNNIVFASIILIILLAHAAISNNFCILDFCIAHDLADSERNKKFLLAFGAFAALANCVIDLGLTWDFYNPKFAEDQRIVVEEDRKSRS